MRPDDGQASIFFFFRINKTLVTTLWFSSQGLQAQVFRHIDAQVFRVKGNVTAQLLAQRLGDFFQVLAQKPALASGVESQPSLLVNEQGTALLWTLAAIVKKMRMRVLAAILKAISAESTFAKRACERAAMIVVDECGFTTGAPEGEYVVDNLQPVVVEFVLLGSALGLRQPFLQLLHFSGILLFNLLLDAFLSDRDPNLHVIVEDILRHMRNQCRVAEGTLGVLHRAEHTTLAHLLLRVLAVLEGLQ
mmetsp:Transcript_86438/g.249393  ORF Transcript_86438/g.249393 Transcript_86438/m.249393 type:complete len:248 (+) Transcript_86438:79-822(+)